MPLTGFKTELRKGRRAKPIALWAVTGVCLILLALLAVAQVAHTHLLESDADHCPLCIVMHSVVPVAAAAAVVVFVQVGTPAPLLEARPIVRHWNPKLFTRPPPTGC